MTKTAASISKWERRSWFHRFFLRGGQLLKRFTQILSRPIVKIGVCLAVVLHCGFAVGEMSVSSNRWTGGSETQVAFTPSYVWRLGKGAELLFGVPIGLTSSTDRGGGVVKFTFELG